MLSRLAARVVPFFGRLTVTADPGARLEPGSILVVNHTSTADPALVLAALRQRLAVEPVLLATAGLWRIPLLGRALTREGHVPVHRGSARAAAALDHAAVALASGRHVMLYAEGRIPTRPDSAENPPEAFRTGLARLAEATGRPVVPIGQAGARRITSGGRVKQIAGVLTAPVRRPCLHVHIGAPLRLPADVTAATELAHGAVTAAWRTAAGALGEPAATADRRL
ncbi:MULTISPECIES: 1-acyl-sn-glycerol-3-phosphate acyltransferase [unclassified Streptomyces]|uniref:lysophospholipid acyltransferase family protein n=1 Tax=unclassified Streptomyces TaxID=2593676 RepID=UPI0016556C27|nr:lysophospholipid acyltransferase family protein [Streptomyces sp. CB02980]MCB8901334.1 1-acyl-sn-glycerol-3-phosphate acyltransferase [Streptomyces sp. CB02980]